MTKVDAINELVETLGGTVDDADRVSEAVQNLTDGIKDGSISIGGGGGTNPVVFTFVNDIDPSTYNTTTTAVRCSEPDWASVENRVKAGAGIKAVFPAFLLGEDVGIEMRPPLESACAQWNVDNITGIVFAGDAFPNVANGRLGLHEVRLSAPASGNPGIALWREYMLSISEGNWQPGAVTTHCENLEITYAAGE